MTCQIPFVSRLGKRRGTPGFIGDAEGIERIRPIAGESPTGNPSGIERMRPIASLGMTDQT